jgi:hypothetical protein
MKKGVEGTNKNPVNINGGRTQVPERYGHNPIGLDCESYWNTVDGDRVGL